MTFQLQRYAEWLRDTSAEPTTAWPELLDDPRQLIVGPTGFLRELAHLLACGLLDARFDSLLIPILLNHPEGDLAASLESQNWGLPVGFWTARLADGACILLIEAAPPHAPWIQAAAHSWPHCRFIVAAETKIALRGFVPAASTLMSAPGGATSRPTSSAPSA